MSRVIRARYEGGVPKPLERLDLRDDKEVIVTIESVEEKTAHGLAELIEGLRRETPKVDDPVGILEEMRQ